MNKNTDKNYFIVIDTLRGIAALLVAIVHVSFNLDESWLKTIASYGQHGVIIFFVISGFIISYSLYKSEYKLQAISNFLLRRIARLNPPYYVILFLTILFYIFINIFSENAAADHLDITASRLFFYLTYIVPFTKTDWYNNVFWTLSIEFQYYILIALLYPFLNKNKYLVFLGILVCGFSHRLPYATETINIFGWSTPFLIGISIFLYKTNKINLQEMLVLFAIVFWMCQSQISGQRMLFALFAYLVIMFSQFSSPITNFLGKISYSLYLTHSLFFAIAFSLSKRLIDFDIAFIKEVLAALFLVCSIPIAYWFYIVVEKPSIALAKKFKFSEA
ncbi:acyltransferase [Pseudanabaena biceps]|nr:acyltransferase [Pseudanabaena biceps]